MAHRFRICPGFEVIEGSEVDIMTLQELLNVVNNGLITIYVSMDSEGDDDWTIECEADESGSFAENFMDLEVNDVYAYENHLCICIG